MKTQPPQWPFDQAANVVAVTSTHITRQRLPILLVTHYEEDDGWGFQSGLPVTMADAQLVAMSTVFEIDPSISEVADLRPGFSASRQKVGGEWRIAKTEWTDDER